MYVIIGQSQSHNKVALIQSRIKLHSNVVIVSLAPPTNIISAYVPGPAASWDTYITSPRMLQDQHTKRLVGQSGGQAGGGTGTSLELAAYTRKRQKAKEDQDGRAGLAVRHLNSGS